MVIVETSIFTGQIRRLISDDHYRRLQLALALRPDAGDVIAGSGGLRKLRWSLPGAGKRGSMRVIYYWDRPERIFMLFAYKKTQQDDLSPVQLKQLRTLVQEWLA